MAGYYPMDKHGKDIEAIEWLCARGLLKPEDRIRMIEVMRARERVRENGKSS